MRLLNLSAHHHIFFFTTTSDPVCDAKISGLGMCDHDADHRIKVRGLTSAEVATGIAPVVTSVFSLSNPAHASN